MQAAYARRVNALRTRPRPPAPTPMGESGVGVVGAWLAATMKAHGHNQQTLAAQSGVKQSQISRALRGQVSDLVLQRLATTLRKEVPAEILALTVRGRRPRGAPETTPAAAAATGARPQRAGFDVPIYHALFVGRGPAFYLQAAPTAFAWRPPILATARNAFMLRMPDNSMSPWREQDEPIYCDPDRSAAAARHALVMFEDRKALDPCLICRLLAPPQPGQPLQGSLHRPPRGFTMPTAPVRRAIAILEWQAFMPA